MCNPCLLYTSFGRKSQRLAIPLEPGFVHTVEPGIYFIPELIEMWKAEKKFADFINYEKVETYKDFGGIRNEEEDVYKRQVRKRVSLRTLLVLIPAIAVVPTVSPIAKSKNNIRFII